MFLRTECFRVKISFTLTHIPFCYRKHAYFFCTLFIANCPAIEQRSTKYIGVLHRRSSRFEFLFKNYQQENQCLLYCWIWWSYWGKSVWEFQ